MIRSWMHPEIFLKVSKIDLKLSVVQDYFTGEQVGVTNVTANIGDDGATPTSFRKLRSGIGWDSYRRARPI